MVYSKGTPDQFILRRTPAAYGGSLAESVNQVPLAVAVANRLLDGMGFTGLVNGMVEWDPKQCNVSPGDAIKSLIVNMASIKERPALLNVTEAYDNVPVGIMFDSVEQPEDLNRYALARNLDRLYEAGPSRVYYKLAAALRAHYRIVSRAAHSDTTSVNVWGEYESEFQTDGGIDITFGFSKDKRPDLKQYMVGNVVDDNGISLFAKPLDGNTSDVAWNRECIDSIMDVLKREDLVYVADSKVVTDGLVKKLDGAEVRFLSRLPANFGDGLQRKVLGQVEPGDLRKLEKLDGEEKRADRWFTELSVEHEGIALRMIPQRTSSTKGKGDKAVKEEREGFRSEIDSFQKTYACMKDAEAAVARFVKRMRRAHPMFSIEPRYLTVVETRRGRGRPRKDGSDVMTEERVAVELDFTEDECLREALWKSKEMIVLVSNVPSRKDDPERGMDAEELIRLYNNQWKVEGGFSTIKRPAIADRLFLEKESRAEALVQVFCMGVLLRGLIQLLIRRGIGEIPDEGLPPYGVDGRALQRNVTHEYFIKKVQNILVLYFPATGTFHYCNEAARSRAEFFVRAMGIEPRSLFGGS